MGEMPASIGVAAFVFGLVLILAALVGKELKIAAIELPALDKWRRIASAVLGTGLIALGLNVNGPTTTTSPTATGALTSTPAAAPVAGTVAATAIAATISPTAIASPSPVPVTSTAGSQPVTAEPTSATAPAASPGSAGGCFGDVAEDDLLVIPVERNRRTDMSFSHDQPRDATVAVQFKRGNTLIGGVKINTNANGNGYDIVSVVDAACQPVQSYSNTSRTDQPKEAPYYYDTMAYRFGNIVVKMDMAAGEGDDRLHLRAQETAP